MVDAYVANHLTSVKQLYPQLYRHTEDQLILLENVTDSYSERKLCLRIGCRMAENRLGSGCDGSLPPRH